MALVLKDALIYTDQGFAVRDVMADEGRLSPAHAIDPADEVLNNCLILPGFADVHVHLREPGFSYKETIRTGTQAAAHGGYTTVCTMPNLNPVPDCMESLECQLEIIKKDACINVIPYGSITRGEKGEALSDMEDLAPYVCAFSDDGRGVQSDEMMKTAMEKAKSIGKMITAHCEVNELLKGGYIHDGKYAAEHGHAGICSASEYEQIARDIELAKESGCAYHVCHISTKESVELIRQAKAQGVNITCETGPHYLILCEDDLQEEGRFKMNPPLRSREDRQALLEGLKDGTIDMIATDHAPHSAEEKSKGLKGSAMGVAGLETAFALLYTYLVLPDVITLEKLVELMVINPRKRFGLDADMLKYIDTDRCEDKGNNSKDVDGQLNAYKDFTIFETSKSYKIDPAEFLSKGRATPFEGWEVKGRCLMTVCGGKIAYISRDLMH